jgi:hypothetical protein
LTYVNQSENILHAGSVSTWSTWMPRLKESVFGQHGSGRSDRRASAASQPLLFPFKPISHAVIIGAIFNRRCEMTSATMAMATIAMLFPAAYAADQQPPTYEMVVAGKECKPAPGGTTSCRYRVGESLDFMIDGVGSPDASIMFLKSDFDGDFYASYSLKYECIVVKRGLEKKRSVRRSPLVAYVSPKNGEVFHDRYKCKSGY